MLQLRIATALGALSVEQCWNLTNSHLKTALKDYNKRIKPQSDLDFLEQTSAVDEKDQLSFDILKDIYLTKQETEAAKRSEKEREENNQKIMALIARKREEKLNDLSEEDLMKMLK